MISSWEIIYLWIDLQQLGDCYLWIDRQQLGDHIYFQLLLLVVTQYCLLYSKKIILNKYLKL